jgi:hypothetical protein
MAVVAKHQQHYTISLSSGGVVGGGAARCGGGGAAFSPRALSLPPFAEGLLSRRRLLDPLDSALTLGDNRLARR